MRSVFTVDLPRGSDGKFPQDEEIRDLLRSYGWEHIEISHIGDDEHLKTEKYRELSADLVAAMPEFRAASDQNIIFYGYIVADSTPFMVTRIVMGHITFRLLQEDLSLLLTATDRVVRRIVHGRLNEKLLRISNQKIVIYEKDHEKIILQGRVIPSAVRETIHVDRKTYS